VLRKRREQIPFTNLSQIETTESIKKISLCLRKGDYVVQMALGNIGGRGGKYWSK
jgi:hypothetical protein